MTSATHLLVHYILYATDLHFSDAAKEILKPLNAGGSPLKSLSKEDARSIFAGAQAAFQVTYSEIDRYRQEINAGGVPSSAVTNADFETGSFRQYRRHGGRIQ